MSEILRRFYLREEEFLEEFPGVAEQAVKHLAPDWEPNYHCNDKLRKQVDYFFSTGQLNHLVFNGAAVYETAGTFSSVQIVLHSSMRLVTVRVRRSGNDCVAETIVDQPLAPK